MMQVMPRYEARGDLVLDSYGGGHSFRVEPVMGQSPAEAEAIARIVAAALNGKPLPEPPPRMFAEEPADPGLAAWKSEVEGR